jgi:hypothetical protein
MQTQYQQMDQLLSELGVYFLANRKLLAPLKRSAGLRKQAMLASVALQAVLVLEAVEMVYQGMAQ